MFAEGTCPKASIRGEIYDTGRTVYTKKTSVRKNNVKCNMDGSNFSSNNTVHPYLYKHQQKDAEFFQDKAAIALFENTGCIT
jgi:hypothetical protein